MGGLGSYLVLASIIHAGLFVSLPTSGTRTNGPRAAVASLDLEVESSVRRATPGGGALVAGMNAAATAPAWVPDAPTPVRTATMDARTAAKPVIAGAPVHIDRADEDARSAMTAAQSSDARREREMAMAAAAASDGLARGAGGGPGGDGAGWAAPPIRGRIAFGNGTRGDLTGRVCFLPIGTLRIKDVRNCEYVATIYTDTLDIPERHFSDGFPGVTSRSDWFLIDYTGTFSVTGYGVYVFRLHSDDGSFLYIDDMLVIDNDGKHAPESRTGGLPLAVGQHRIKVRYAQTDDRMALQLFVRLPGSATETIFTTHL
jgi:PA14 domain-containing protein